MPGKWGGTCRACPPLDLPMQYVPKYHQKLGCQANGGGARRARPPLDPPMLTCQIPSKASLQIGIMTRGEKPYRLSLKLF